MASLWVILYNQLIFTYLVALYQTQQINKQYWKKAIRIYLTLTLHLDFTAVLCLTRASLLMDVTLKNKALTFLVGVLFTYLFIFSWCFSFVFFLHQKWLPQVKNVKWLDSLRIQRKLYVAQSVVIKHFCFLSRCNPRSLWGCVCFCHCY